jgi:hypothetical protein
MLNHTTYSLTAANEGRSMNSDEQRADRAERLAYVSQLPTHAELVRKGARYCKFCGTDEAMPGHEC